MIMSAWRHLGALLAATLLCSYAHEALSAGKFRMTSRGQPRTQIVVTTQELPVAFAAQELQRYVKEMSGAELPIVQVPTQRSVIVLAIRSFRQDNEVAQDPREED